MDHGYEWTQKSHLSACEWILISFDFDFDFVVVVVRFIETGARNAEIT